MSLSANKMILRQSQVFALGYCWCGCGTKIPIRESYGHLQRFKRGHLRGKLSCKWKGGIARHQQGYTLLYKPSYPNADQRGYVFEHRYVMEQHLGRLLEKHEVVDHLNGIKTDNRIENLRYCGRYRKFKAYDLRKELDHLMHDENLAELKRKLDSV